MRARCTSCGALLSWFATNKHETVCQRCYKDPSKGSGRRKPVDVMHSEPLTQAHLDAMASTMKDYSLGGKYEVAGPFLLPHPENVMTKQQVIDGLVSMARVFHDDVARQWERDVVIAAIDLLRDSSGSDRRTLLQEFLSWYGGREVQIVADAEAFLWGHGSIADDRALLVAFVDELDAGGIRRVRPEDAVDAFLASRRPRQTRCYISAADWARLPENTYLSVRDVDGRPCEMVVGDPPHGLVDEHGVKLEGWTCVDCGYKGPTPLHKCPKAGE